MIICPVCDNVQPQGDECDNCGRRFPAPAAPVVVATLPELEVTHHQGGRNAVDVQALPELDLTRLKVGPDLPAQVVQDLELTRAGATGEVPVAALPDLDTGRAVDDGVRTQAPTGAVVCRYCRHVQAEGMLCDGCGMRLPRVRQAPAQAPKAKAGADEDWVSCATCHTPVRPGRSCTECGTRAAAVEA